MNVFLAAERGAALLVFALFLVVYSARTRKVSWWRSEYGWMIVLLVTSVLAMITNGLANAIWPGYPYRSQVTAALLAGLLVAGAWLVHLMVEALPKVDPPADGPPDGSDEPENG